jgi:GTPase SAR1 family protein
VKVNFHSHSLTSSSVTFKLTLWLRETVEYDPTVEDSYSTQLSLDGKDYAIEIIDTAGQEEYRGLWAETSAREGDGFILT